MLPRTGNNPLVFESTYLDSLNGTEVTRQLVFPDEVIDAFDVQDAGNGIISIKTKDGDSTGFDGTFTVIAGPGDNEVTYNGFLNQGIREFEYTAVTDPAPLVIIAAIGVGAIVCELIIALNDCSDSQAILASIEACRETNGKPNLTITTTFGVSFDPFFSLGCNTNCVFECK
ncbi:MAG: hypothetical protein IIA49_07150 [Bacteroidetes bacterium]|nr:hypothetical protein [Bacteroidota bacterium]